MIEKPEEHPSQPEPVASDISSMISSIPMLRLAISSAGVLGLLTAIGYLIEAARENLLGVTLPGAHSADEYVTAGGEFFAFLLGLLWRHLSISIAGLAIAIVAAVVINLLRQRLLRFANRTMWTIAFVALIAAISIKSFMFDHPYISMSGLLAQPPLCETAVLQGDARRQHDAWEQFLCSRNDLTLSSRIGCREATFERTLGMTKHGGLSIEQAFLINVMLTLFLSYLSLALYLSNASREYSMAALALLRIVLVGAVVINLLALPYVYGKVVRRTSFPAGQVIAESVGADGNPALTSVTALIVAASDKFVTVYDLQGQQYLQFERSKVKWLSVDRTDDIVARRTVATLAHSNCP
jgi:hypothetical protein